MLPARHRLREASDFRAVLRGPGAARAGGRLLVVHAALTDPTLGRPARVGFVVSGAVGGAVVRNRVKRRLREALRPRLLTLPAGRDLVVRAQPAAAAASWLELCGELDRCVDVALRRLP